MSWGVRLVACRSVAVCIGVCLMRLGLGWRWCCWVSAWVFETHHLLCDKEHNKLLEGCIKTSSIFTAPHENAGYNPYITETVNIYVMKKLKASGSA